MRISRLLLAFSLTLCAAPLTSQQPRSATLGAETQTILTFTVQSSVAGATESQPQVPVAILERTAAEPNLANLSVQKLGTRADASLVLTFVFDDEAEFRRWYAGQSARAIFALLKEHGRVESYNLEVRRFPLAQFLRGAN